MTRLEEALREMLTAKAAQAPALTDPAGEALRRGRASRRRRVAGTSALAVVVLVLARTGAVVAQSRFPNGRLTPPAGRTNPSPGVSVAPQGPRVVVHLGIESDVIVGDQLWTADGRLVRLTGVGSVTRAYRVPAGWVFGGADRVRLMRPDGTSLALSGQGDRWALSADGTRIAFVIDRTLHVGEVTRAGLAISASVEVAAGSAPATFVGKRILVANEPAGQPRRFDLVDPARAGAVAWSATLLAVYGVRGNGWLAVRAGSEIRLVNVAATVTGRTDFIACPAAPDAPVTWNGPKSVLSGTGRTAVRCDTAGQRDATPLPSAVGQGWQFVSRPGSGGQR